MDKNMYRKYCGNMQQLAYVRPMQYMEGRAEGLSAIDVRNDLLRFTVMTGKGLDISELSYRGVQISFMAKPGLMGRGSSDTNGQEAQRSIMGGFFFTCGLENIGAPSIIEGIQYPMHGRIRTTPAEHLSTTAKWEDERYELEVSGDLREAELFGENLLMQRTIQTTLGNNSIRLFDRITNEGFRDEPLFLMYHINLGYPYLNEHLKLKIPSEAVTARTDPASKSGISNWSVIDRPADLVEEQVFIHSLNHSSTGQTAVASWNTELKIGLVIDFNQMDLPYFMQWKSMASGDYVLGLEPSTALVYGRTHYKEKNMQMPIVHAQATRTFALNFSFYDSEKEVDQAIDEILQS